METCYMCDRPATSREHVPPKCLFPDKRDIGRKNFRKNLITVPSCKLHNSEKSSDDEFLMVSIAGIVGNNSIGLTHNLTKVRRAIKRSAYRLLRDIFLEGETYLIRDDKNKFLDVIWGKPNHIRLNRCFEHIVRGIYHYHFSKRFHGEVKTLLGFLKYDESSAENFSNLIRDKCEVELASKDKIGGNPGVFYYQVSDADQFGLITIRLCFYGGVDVYCAMIPESTQVPRTFVGDLINAGIKTTLVYRDTKYELN